MSDIQKNYSPKAIEQHWYQEWEAKCYFRCGNSAGSPYTIMLPPPNVTGTLHMGHGFQHTLMDILTRYHRMMGDDTLWQPGTDHAGIATQMVVERQLKSEGVTRHDLGREKFVEKIWDWKEKSGGTISGQMRRLGTSVDWERERFTMDDGLTDAVREQFVQLCNEGLIYRGKRLVNWDPVLHTAVSDIEVISEEEKGFMWHFRYPLADGSGHLTIATTRPETMLGDSAVAVHPEDNRYQHLIGKMIALPLCDRGIPIIADDYVDQGFGTGCVKITPAHDFNDYEIGQRHQLPMINILTKDAKINDIAPEAYHGLDRFDARKKIVKDMDALGLLDKVEPHLLKVPHGDRTGTVIEPFLTEQWFMKMEELAKPAIEAVESGKVRFIPDNWKNTYYSWMRDIQDWCISRQLWWGHRIPAWYDAEGNIYVGRDETEVRAKHDLSDDLKLRQDEDVFDTWFSSALWPFSTLGWPEKTPELSKYYPSSVLVTGFDIIFFWVARMMVMGLKFMGEVPFKEVYMTGLIRDAEGQKMSKSKGNVLDPVDLIDGISLETLLEKRTASLMQPQMKPKVEKQTRKEFPNGIEAYGADALRFTFAALASTSRDICFDVSRMEGYRNFCNKLWNASRFVMMNLEGYNPHASIQKEFGVAERWIWSEFNTTVASIHKQMTLYRFDLVAQNIYDFVWNTYCGWYVEFAKSALIHANKAQKQGIQYTLISVLEGILKIAHPIIPFITEEIYQQVKVYTGSEVESIMLQAYPSVDVSLEDREASADVQWLQAVIVGIRTIRSEMNVKPSIQIPLLIKNAGEKDLSCLKSMQSMIQSMTKVKSIELLSDNDKVPASSVSVIGRLELYIPLAGLIDVAAEKNRLGKESGKLDKELDRILKKLSNERFVANAPEAVVQKEKDKCTELKDKKEKLAAQLDKLIATSIEKE
jgi:valyl-tRNA synthetase